jgi:short-subunit dehydrogenase
MCSYSVTKAGVVSLSETLRSELSRKNIGVTVVCPTYFKTNEMNSFVSLDERQRELANAIRNRSSKILRILSSDKTAEDVARYVVKSIDRNRLYSIPQFDGRFLWTLKRYFPEFYYRMVSILYRKGYFDKIFGI